MNKRVEQQSSVATVATVVPTVVVFHCDGGSLATPAEEPVHPGAGFIRVPCVGRVSSGDVLRALRSGAAGVLLAGCAPGACRFHDAAAHGRDVATDLSPMLEAMGLGAERVRFAPTGRGAALTEAVAAFIADVADYEVIRPEPAEVSRMSAIMNVLPPYPHHGAVQEAALLSHMRHDTPRWPAWAEGANARAETLLYVCDLPLLDGLLGRHFPVDMDATLGSCMALLKRAGVEVSVVPALPCCGHDFALAGVAQERAHEARRVRVAIGATGAQRVVTVSPECEWHLREGYAELDVALDQEVVGLVNLLYEHRDALVPDVELGPAGRCPAVLYVGDATTESRDSALELLTMAGVAPRAVLPREYDADASPPQPRGSAGVKGFVHCDGKARIAQDRLLSEVEELGATTLITLSVTAAIHLACAQRRGSWRRSSVRVESLFDHLAARLAPPAVV
jgi:coenzyme F420-reducing hydrogenase delta subunit